MARTEMNYGLQNSVLLDDVRWLNKTTTADTDSQKKTSYVVLERGTATVDLNWEIIDFMECTRRKYNTMAHLLFTLHFLIDHLLNRNQ